MVTHINHLSQNLVKANAMVSKLCHFLSVATIKSVYYAILHSNLLCVCTAWGQELNSKQRINLLQKRAMRIINFASFAAHILPVSAELKINKFLDLFFIIIVCLSINIFWASLPQCHHMFSF